MRALIWNGRELRFVSDAPEPEPHQGSAIVRVSRAGICSTDLQILQGYMGFVGVPGHEFVGEVIEGPPQWRQRRVVGEINFSCGRCSTCLAGRRRHCPTRTVMGIKGADGTFAEMVRIPLENLHLVPAGIDDSAASFVEPLAAAFEVHEQTRERVGGNTTVLGAGKLGLLVAQVLAQRGDRVTVVCRNERSQKRARALGLEPVDLRTAARGQDLVVESTGSVEGLPLALDLVRPLGAVVMKSTVADRHTLDFAPVVVDEISLIGSRCGPFEPALKALRDGSVSVAPLLEDTAPLSRGPDAMRAAAAPGALKFLLDPAS